MTVAESAIKFQDQNVRARNALMELSSPSQYARTPPQRRGTITRLPPQHVHRISSVSDPPDAAPRLNGHYQPPPDTADDDFSMGISPRTKQGEGLLGSQVSSEPEDIDGVADSEWGEGGFSSQPDLHESWDLENASLRGKLYRKPSL